LKQNIKEITFGLGMSVHPW